MQTGTAVMWHVSDHAAKVLKLLICRSAQVLMLYIYIYKNEYVYLQMTAYIYT